MPKTQKKDLDYFMQQLELGKGKEDVLTVVYFKKDLKLQKYNPLYDISKELIGEELGKRVPKIDVFRRYRVVAGKLRDYGREPNSSNSCFLEFSIVAILEEGDDPEKIFIQAEKGTLPHYYHRVIKNATYSRINVSELKNIKIIPISAESE